MHADTLVHIAILRIDNHNSVELSLMVREILQASRGENFSKRVNHGIP